MFFRFFGTYALVFLLAGCATGQRSLEGPVRVTAAGESIEEAKQQAFRKAVELRVGAIILSQRIVVDDDLREKVNNFSSGFVDKHETISIVKRSGLFEVTLDVWVRDSSLAGALVRQYGQAHTVDGTGISDAVQNRDIQRNQGHGLIKELLAGWPRTGIEVLPGWSYGFEYRNDRSVVLVIPSVSVRYAAQFEKGFREALQSIKLTGRRTRYAAVVAWGSPGLFNALLGGNPDYYPIEDSETVGVLEATFQKQPLIRVSLMSATGTLGSSCIYLDHAHMNRVWRGAVLFHDMPSVSQNFINLSFDVDRSIIKDVKTLHIDIVERRDCRNIGEYRGPGRYRR
jgi:hypothetical protein